MPSNSNDLSPKSKRGGARTGAGRKSLGAQIASGVLAGIAAIENRSYEAAERYQQNRHPVYSPTSPRLDFQAYDRTELARLAWWAYNNSPETRRGIDATCRYTVGAGLIPQSLAKDTTIRAQYETAFRDRYTTNAFAFDLAARDNFLTAQTSILKHTMLAGDFFGQFVLDSNGGAMMRFIPGENVASPGETDAAWFDGAKINSNGRTIAWRVYEAVGGNKANEVPADSLLHFVDDHRKGYVRGPSHLAPALNDIRDTMEMIGFTKQAFKAAAQHPFAIFSPDAGKIGLGAALTAANASGNTQAMIIDQLDSSVGRMELKPTDRIEHYKNEHPGETFEPFMDFLQRRIAWALGPAPEIIFTGKNTGGVDFRAKLADAQIFFDSRRNWLVEKFCRPFWTFAIWHEIEAGRLPYTEDWYRVGWQTPPDVTVDFGRDFKTLCTLASEGHISSDTVGRLVGIDPDAEDDLIINRAIARRKKVEDAAKASGMAITFGEVFAGDAMPAPVPTAAPAVQG